MHEGGWTLRRAAHGYAAEKPWPPPGGDDLRTLTAIPDPLTGEPKLHLLPGQPQDITADTPTPAWAGERFDVHWVVSVLCDRQHVREHTRAEHDRAGRSPGVELTLEGDRGPDVRSV